MDTNVQVIIASVDMDNDGPMTDLYRFYCPSSIIEGLSNDDIGAAAARYIAGLVNITDPSEWWIVNDGTLSQMGQEHIDPTGWFHHDGLDYQAIKGNIFATDYR
jgi:hypothetical protein